MVVPDQDMIQNNTGTSHGATLKRADPFKPIGGETLKNPKTSNRSSRRRATFLTYLKALLRGYHSGEMMAPAEYQWLANRCRANPKVMANRIPTIYALFEYYDNALTSRLKRSDAIERPVSRF